MGQPLPGQGCESFSPHEGPAKVRLIVEPTVERNVCQQHRRVEQQLLAFPDPLLAHPLLWRHPGAFLEHPAEVTARQGTCLGELGHRYAHVQMRQHHLLGGSQLPRFELPGRFQGDSRQHSAIATVHEGPFLFTRGERSAGSCAR